VEVIVRHCTSRYEDCAKYQELTERAVRTEGEKSTRAPNPDTQPVYGPSGGLVLPLKLDREVVTLVNHQLRTPLTSIRSFTEILLSYAIDDPDARRRFLQIIHEETERLSHTLDTLFGRAATPALAPMKPSYDNQPSNVTTSV
jgi:hypothetical protein